MLQTCIQDETTPFYVRTTFQPATDRAKPTHCAKKNHLDASGVGHCSGNLCDLAEVLVLAHCEDAIIGARLTGILGVIIF